MGLVSDLVVSTSTSCAKEAGNSWKCWGSPTETIRKQVMNVVAATGEKDQPFASGDNLCTIGGNENAKVITCTAYDRYENGGLALPAANALTANTLAANSSSVKIQRFGPFKNLKSFGGSRSFMCVVDGDDVKCQYSGNFKPPLPAKFKAPRLVAATLFSVCVIDDAGLKCFGSAIDDFKSHPEWKDATALYSSTSGVCAIRQSGKVECETDPTRDTALLKIPADLEPSKEIGIGFVHMCSLSQLGKVTCWGSESAFPELSTVPNFDSKVLKLGVGDNHSCVLLESGLVKCWGKADSDQLRVPVSSKAVLKVAAGKYFSCVYDKSGVTCGGTSSSIISSPVLGQVVSVSVPASNGETVCAIEALPGTPANASSSNLQSTAKCWGYDPTMIKVPEELSNPNQISVSETYACASTVNSVLCWGGDRSLTEGYPDKLSNPRKIATGKRHACVIDDYGLACWGTLEAETATTKLDLRVPPQVEGRGIALQVAAGSEHTCVLTRAGEVQCWGDNSKGQLNVPRLSNPISIGAVESMSCAT
ncbi:MAG: hypothetical protein EOP05_06675, partial [Proteobacteria bacterium]